MTKNSSLVVVMVSVVLLGVVLVWWLRPTSSIVPPVRDSTGRAPTVSTDAPIISPPATGTILAGAVTPSTGSAASDPKTANPTPSGLPRATGVQTGSGAVNLPTSTNVQEAMIDLDKTRRMIRDYNTLMGENPVGTNAEIMQAVMGGNSRQATLGPGAGQKLNSKGELVDQWGTPYFFHQLSGDHMEIHSAGPDKIMGTDDDLILK